ncbi:MAG: hypothetical protein MJ249_17275, partial [Kiritimatiellae bacterium]|nr:hypothetical protein [Kiritimatiellia bacterium]
MLAVLLLASALTTAEVVPLPQPLVWAREPSKLSFAETANGGCRVESSAGAGDWVVRCTDRTPVKPGEIYAFSVRVSAEKLEEGLTSSAELRDEHGVVLDWQHAMKPLPKTGAAVNVFVVPPRASQMSLRVVGKGAAKAEFSAMRLERRGRFRFSPAKDRVF